ncbi:MAG: SCO family protein [Betaproteobacteria bacterium]|jgi:hypothetical protein
MTSETSHRSATAAAPASVSAPPRRGRLKLLLVLLACAAPVLASYFTYYVIRPEGRVNYADLIEPQRPLLDLALAGPDEASGTLASLRGKWVLVVIAAPDCPPDCERSLYNIRQVRLTTGRERERVERLWILNAPGEPAASLIAQHDGLLLRRASADVLASRFPAADGGRIDDHIFIIDPLGNLMMRFPAKADPSRMKKDLNKLLRASRVG